MRLRGNSSSFLLPRKYSALSRSGCFTLSFAPLTAQFALGFEMDFGPRFPVDLAMVLAVNLIVAVLIYCGIMLWGLLGTWEHPTLDAANNDQLFHMHTSVAREAKITNKIIH
jgi:hypothetical protein